MRKMSILLAGVLIFGACAAPVGSPAASPTATAPVTAASPTPTAKPPLKTIKVGVIPISNMVPLYAAQKLGYFADNGLTVETTAATQGAALVSAVVGGSLDFSYSNYISLLAARAQSIDVVAFANMNNVQLKAPNSTSVTVRASDNITSPKDLVGKTIAVSVLNALPWLYARSWLRVHGVDPNSVKYVEVPFPNMGDALATKQVDAAVSTEPFNAILIKAGSVKTIGYPYVESQPGLNLAGWISTSDWVSKNQATAKAFVTAIDKAVKYLADNPSQKIALTA
ncbi:MAG: NitT/TauT family transport system substrate-binding protein, partial [Chloroflexota bacterium]|nr:NitT/TauT family transport system substrate-binding protein [Chloroflexota bacterium]